MLQKTLESRIYYRACCFVLYFVIASASFNGYYDKWHFAEDGASGEDTRFSFEMMVQGTAYRPYVYRQLLPATASLMDRVVPAPFKTWLYNGQASGPQARVDPFFDTPTAEDPVYFFRYLILYASTFLFTLIAVYAMHLVCRALEVSPVAAALAPAIVVLLVPYIESGGGFFYDYPELAFLALAVWIALKFDWWWIIPVAALATWNKESFLFVIPTLYPFLRRRSSRLGSLLAVGVLCLVCIAVFYPIRLQFAHNPGGALEFHWHDQLSYFLSVHQLFLDTEKTYAVFAVKAFTIFPLALLIWTVSRGWKHLPRVIQRHGQIAAAINIPLYFLFCSPGESRDLSLLYVFFLLVVAVNLSNWIGSFARSDSASTG